MKAWLGAAVLAVAAGGAAAQSQWRVQAVPVIPPAVFVAMQTNHWNAPRATEFAAQAGELQRSLASHCAGGAAEPARGAWRRTLAAWSRLSSVAVGPLVTRRSARRIDFQPVRPTLIEQALKAAGDGAPEMDRIGSAARGFAALEWLLWPQSRLARGPDAAAACRLAQALAADLLAEADVLAAGFTPLDAEALDEAEVVERMGEAINQWVGGIDALRMQAIERPLLEALARRTSRPVLPRALSGASAEDRASRWAALRALLVFDGPVAPQPGTALVPVETVLRGRGLNPLADRVVAGAKAVDRALAAARKNTPATLRAAGAALASLRNLVEAEVAPVLEVRIGFSDADGD